MKRLVFTLNDSEIRELKGDLDELVRSSDFSVKVDNSNIVTYQSAKGDVAFKAEIYPTLFGNVVVDCDDGALRFLEKTKYFEERRIGA